MTTSAVRNAADPVQVKRAERIARRQERRDIEKLAKVLEDPDVREVLWRILRKAGVLTSVFNTHGSVMAYNAGRQDFGLRLLNEIVQAAPQRYLDMEREARERAERDEIEREALQTPRADEAKE